MSDNIVHYIHTTIEWAALGIEVLAVALVVTAVVLLVVTRGTIRFLFNPDSQADYAIQKHQLGKAMLLGLELMVAADVIRTVVTEPTLTNVSVLGLLVLVRTLLSWSLFVEMEGRWPWQGTAELSGPSRLSREST